MNEERELKLTPEDASLLDRLAQVDRLGELRVTDRSRQLQRNSFFDTPSHALSASRIGFRRRAIQTDSRLATWSIKAGGTLVEGVATRTEIELQLDPATPPGQALFALEQTARQRDANVLADELEDALRSGDAPSALPFLETETDRVIVNLVSDDRGWKVELALDRVRLMGHDYAELEIEAELKRGDESALDVVRRAIEAMGGVRNSDGSKLSRAAAHLTACRCTQVRR